MNLKKTLALSLAALAVVGAISGCGGDKKEAKAPAEKKETVTKRKYVRKKKEEVVEAAAEEKALEEVAETAE